MKFSIGDRILLKRTGEEGRVVAFLSKTMMEVEVDGVHFPVYNEEVDHPYLKWFTAEKKTRSKPPVDIPVEKPSARSQRLTQGIYLSFIAQFAAGADDVIESFKIHFINETPDVIAMSYWARNAAGDLLFQHKANLHAFGNIYLHPLTLEALNEQPRMQWELSSEGSKGGPVKGVVRLRAAQLVRFIREMLDENRPAFSVMLAADAATDESVIQQSETMPLLSVGTAARRDSDTRLSMHTSAESVVDLHIHAIVSDKKSMSPDEILRTQLRFLQQKLQAAIAGGLPEMIIIHGLGKGTLRHNVHELLASTPGVANFSNHWMSGYGWGATLVTFHHR